MAEDKGVLIEEVLIDPLENILARIGQGIAEAQRSLDLNSIATQTLLDNDPVLKDYHLQATWYHMPEVELELKMTLNMCREDKRKGNQLLYRKLRMYAAPHNASTQNIFKLEAQGTSKIKARIVSVPPAK